MVFAQFWHLGLISKTPIEACGDRAVIILDGRNNLAVWQQLARQECAKRGYIGFSIHKGDTFTHCRQVIGYTPIEVQP